MFDPQAVVALPSRGVAAVRRDDETAVEQPGAVRRVGEQAVAGAAEPEQRGRSDLTPESVAALLRLSDDAVALEDLDDAEILETLAGLARVEAHAAARMRRLAAVVAERSARALAWVTDRVEIAGSAADEVSLRLGISGRAAGRLIAEGVLFEGTLRHVGEALEDGTIDSGKASRFADHTARLDAETARKVCDAVLPHATHLSHHALGKRLERAVIRQDADGAARRSREAACRRALGPVRTKPDGMASLTLFAPLLDVALVDEACEAGARAARATGDPRTLEQLRADALATMAHTALTTGTLAGQQPAGEVNQPASPPTSAMTGAHAGAGSILGESVVGLFAATIGHPTLAPLTGRRPDGRADAARADTVRADTVRADTVRADTARADTVRADTARADATRARTMRWDGEPARTRGDTESAHAGTHDDTHRAQAATHDDTHRAQAGTHDDTHRTQAPRHDDADAERALAASPAASPPSYGAVSTQHASPELLPSSSPLVAARFRTDEPRLTLRLPETVPEHVPGNGAHGPDAPPGLDAVAELVGHGPVPVRLATEILTRLRRTGCAWLRVVTGPSAVAPPSDRGPRHNRAGETPGYRIPAAMARRVRVRHPICVAPLCTVASTRCDCDHVTPWPRGETDDANLRPTCRRHHRLKTHVGSTLTLQPDGSTVWTTPLGQRFHTTTDGHTTRLPGRTGTRSSPTAPSTGHAPAATPAATTGCTTAATTADTTIARTRAPSAVTAAATATGRATALAAG